MLKKFSQIIATLIIIFFASYGFALSDSSINGSVQNKLTTESNLSNTPIKVSTNKGVVALTGTVDSSSQANLATELAQSVPGVKDVDTSKLTVKGSSHPLNDSLITAKVKGMFIQQKLFGDKDVAAMSISVETNNGVVTLSGTADNQEQITNAINMAKKIAGVKEVKSTVTVSNS